MTPILLLRSSGGLLGAERVILELCANLPRLGFEPHVGVFSDSSNSQVPFVQALRAAGYAYFEIPCARKVDLGAVRCIQQYVRAHGIKLAHSHGYKENFYLLLARLGLPLVATNHLWKRTTAALRLYARLDAFLLRRFAKVVAVSKPIFQEMKAIGFGENKLELIQNGVTMPSAAISRDEARRAFGEPVPSAGRLVIGTLSSLTSEKGLHLLLSALPTVLQTKREIEVMVIGDGPERSALEEQARTHGLPVRFLGVRSDTVKLLSGLDLFVLPSLIEGLPMALLEAMAVGCPVVATAVGDVPSAVTDGVNGWLVTPGDAAALADTLTRALSSPDLRTRYGAAARETVLSRFSSEKMAENYGQLYRGVLGR